MKIQFDIPRSDVKEAVVAFLKKEAFLYKECLKEEALMSNIKDMYKKIVETIEMTIDAVPCGGIIYIDDLFYVDAIVDIFRGIAATCTHNAKALDMPRHVPLNEGAKPILLNLYREIKSYVNHFIEKYGKDDSDN